MDCQQLAPWMNSHRWPPTKARWLKTEAMRKFRKVSIKNFTA